MDIPLNGGLNLLLCKYPYMTPLERRWRLVGDMSVDGRYVFDVTTLGDEGTWTLANRRVFAHCDKGFPDGIKCDTLGNVYSGCGDGVHVLLPSAPPSYLNLSYLSSLTQSHSSLALISNPRSRSQSHCALPLFILHCFFVSDGLICRFGIPLGD
jgi:hypothetical protein